MKQLFFCLVSQLLYFCCLLGSPQFLIVSSDFWFLLVVLLQMDFFSKEVSRLLNILGIPPFKYCYFLFVLHPCFCFCNYFQWVELVIIWLVFLVVLLTFYCAAIHHPFRNFFLSQEGLFYRLVFRFLSGVD